jgi:Undecaprenyl-phosphate galactose phosphotransferase WbaP
MIELRRLIRKTFQIISLILIDISAFYLSMSIAWFIRVEIIPLFYNNLPPFSFSYGYLVSLFWIPVLYLFFIFYENFYSGNLPFWDETRNLVKAITIATLTIMAIVTVGKMGDRVSRTILLGIWSTSLFIFPVFRLWGKRLLYAAGIWRERVLVLGAGNAGRLVVEGLSRERHMGYEIIGFLDDDEDKKGKTIGGKKVFGSIRYLPRFVRELDIKTVIIAMPSLPSERLTTLTAWVQGLALNTMVIPDIKGVAILNTELLHLFYEKIFLMNIRNNLKSLTNRSIKRCFDLVVSVLSIPFFIPLILIIGAAIRLETPGPVIYAHERIGRNGRPFLCYKFRTMHRDAEERLKVILDSNEKLRDEWEKSWKLKEDPRVTRIGRLLRKTSLDELPQIWNVIKGEMSLVGPRPYLPRELREVGENYSIISSIKPGITGLWQVSGRSNTGYDYRIKLDTWYVMNWSLWFDVVIIFKTIMVVLKGEGAY